MTREGTSDLVMSSLSHSFRTCYGDPIVNEQLLSLVFCSSYQNILDTHRITFILSTSMGTTKTIVTYGVKSGALSVNKPSDTLAFLLEKDNVSFKNWFRIFKIKKLKGKRKRKGWFFVLLSFPLSADLAISVSLVISLGAVLRNVKLPG